MLLTKLNKSLKNVNSGFRDRWKTERDKKKKKNNFIPILSANSKLDVNIFDKPSNH